MPQHITGCHTSIVCNILSCGSSCRHGQRFSPGKPGLWLVRRRRAGPLLAESDPTPCNVVIDHPMESFLAVLHLQTPRLSRMGRFHFMRSRDLWSSLKISHDKITHRREIDTWVFCDTLGSKNCINGRQDSGSGEAAAGFYFFQKI